MFHIQLLHFFLKLVLERRDNILFQVDLLSLILHKHIINLL